MRTKKVLGITAGLAAALLVAGCSGGGDSGDGAASQDQHVTLWLYPVLADEAANKAHWDQVVEDFTADHPEITVDYEIFPWANRDEALQTAIVAKTGPDLVYLIPDQLAAYQDAIEPIGPYLSDERKSDLLDNVAQSVTIDGELMGAPMLTSALPLLCDGQVFEAAGLTEYPETWDDVLEIAPQLSAQGLYTISYSAYPEMTLNQSFYPLLWQAGGSVYSEDGSSVAFNDEPGVEALSFLTELAEQDALVPDALTTNVPMEQTAIAQHKVACTWNHPVAEVQPFWDDIRVVAPLKNKESVSYGTVGSLTMLKGAQDKDAAAAFAEYATGEDAVVPYLTQAGFFSALKSTGELYADDPVLSAVEATLPSTTVGELNTSSRELMGVLVPEIQAALLGQKSAQEALDAAAVAAEPLLAK